MLERDRTYNDVLDRIERLEMRIEDLRDVARPAEVVVVEEGNWQALAGWVSTGTVLQDVNGRIVLDPTIPRILIDADGYIESADFVAETSGFRIDGGTAEFNDIIVRGTIYAEAGEISGVLTIGAAGGIYQGTGTFAAPTTGLKIWNDGGIGRLATYNTGVAQVYFGTDGMLYAGAGTTRLGADGLLIWATTSADPIRSVKWHYNDGGTDRTIGSVGGHYGVPEGIAYTRASVQRNAGDPWTNGVWLTLDAVDNVVAANWASLYLKSTIVAGSSYPGADLYDYLRVRKGLVVGNITTTPVDNAVIVDADVHPDSDGRGLMTRAINRYSYDDHFRSGVIPTGYAWQGAPLGGTPASLLYSYQGEYMRYPPAAATRYFLSRAVTNAAANWQNKRLNGRFSARSNGRYGLRFDDGTDNNYAQIYATGEANDGTMSVSFQYRAGGGAVTTVTSAINVPASEFACLQLIMLYSAPNYTAYGYLLGEDGAVVLPSGFQVAITWVPVAGRAGLFGEGPGGVSGTSMLCDWFGNEFV